MSARDVFQSLVGANRERRTPLSSVASIAVVAIGGSLIAAHGAIAAADTPTPALPVIAPSETAATDSHDGPIQLAGRWTGQRFGYGSRVVPHGAAADKGALTFDIVQCGTDWCGIAVKADQSCGAAALKLSAKSGGEQSNAFSGNLELAKGSDPYVIEAWYRAGDSESAGTDLTPRLSLIGDTGPELMMLRRSFPFQAELARTGEAVCTLDKATS